MSYSKYYNPTNWENYPSEDTAINAARLNNIEDGVDTLDDRIVELSTDKSEVDWNQMLIAGRKIAEITINGITKDVLAPEGGGGGGGSTVTITPTISTGTKIADYVIDGYGGSLYAPNGGGGASALDDLTDVDLTTPSNGQVLKYDSVSSKWINATGGGGGGLLPHLYIDSEAGSTVTVVAPDSSVITPTQISSGHWECDVPSYGVYTIHAVLNGDDAVLSLTVDDVKEYHVTDSHYSYTLNVYAPTGSTIRVTATGETYTGTGAGSNPVQFALHQASTTYSIQVTLDGVSKTDSVTTPSTSGGTGSKTLEFGTINVTLDTEFVGETITCVNGGTTISKTASSTSLVFYPPTTGTWTISGTISGTTYSVDAEVVDLSTPVSVILQTIPEGATVLPTDDIQTWLKCANITDKSYTTLAEVLADRETFETLIADSNACDYMARSTTWAEIKVPTMTDDTHPSGEVFASGNYSNMLPYMSFDGDENTTWLANANTLNNYIGYKFTRNVTINRVKIKYYTNYGTQTNLNLTIQVGNNKTGWETVDVVTVTVKLNNVSESVIEIANPKEGDSIRIYDADGVKWYAGTNSFAFLVTDLQFYGGVVNNQDAMALIGKYDYCSNELLSNATWASAIANSDYWDSVLQPLVPKMTSATTPSGEVISSGYPTNYDAWKAFDGDNSTQGAISQGANGYIGYKFTKPVKVCKVHFDDSAGNKRLKTYKIQGSNTGDTNDWHDISEELTVPSSFIVDESFFNNVDYEYTRIQQLTTQTAGQGNISYYTIQFYGRASSSVSNTNGIIHTAMGNESVYCVETGDTFTATDGIATVDFSDFDEGVYTFGSTTAKDPTNLSNDYTKQFRITKSPYGGTTELYLMPDAVKTLYWWGYVGEELTSSDWTYANISTPQNAPTYNTTDVTLTCNNNGNSASFVGTSNTKHLTKVNAIGYCTSTGSALGKVSVGSTKDASSQTFGTLPLNTIGLASYTATEGDYYIGISTYYVTTQSKFNALWYE